MSNRSVKFVPALLAGIVAGTNLATMTDLRAQVLTTAAEAATSATQAAADSCLAAPKGATPSGSHWYYRIDRTTKRQCWYLREESDRADDKFARAAPPASRSPTRVPNGSPSKIAPRQIRQPKLSRERLEQSPHRPLRMPSAPPCRTCSLRRRWRRYDGTTLPPRARRAIQPISKSPPQPCPQNLRRRPSKCSSPQRIRLRLPQPSRRRQSRPRHYRSCFW
jgi:hypothetical protein